MIVPTAVARATFWWWTAVLFGGVRCATTEQAQEQARRLQIAADSGSVPLPAIPMTVSEDNVHVLSAVRFPPPALFFADPDKKWTMDDFEKPDRPTTYAVTDADGADDAEETTVTARPPPDGAAAAQLQREPEATTIAAPEEAKATTTVGPHQTAATDGRVDVSPRRPVAAVQRWPDRAGWYVTATAAPVVRGHRRPPAPQRRQTILLTSRPLPPPPPLDSVRFPNVEYVVSGRDEATAARLSYVR